MMLISASEAPRVAHPIDRCLQIWLKLNECLKKIPFRTRCVYSELFVFIFFILFSFFFLFLWEDLKKKREQRRSSGNAVFSRTSFPTVLRKWQSQTGSRMRTMRGEPGNLSKTMKRLRWRNRTEEKRRKNNETRGGTTCTRRLLKADSDRSKSTNLWFNLI